MAFFCFRSACFIHPVIPAQRARILAAGAALCVIAGCAHKPPAFPPSEGHIAAAPATAGGKPSDIPPPVKASSFVPKPAAAVKMPTYSVVVNEVPVKELLFALARDTRQNIDIHPALEGRVSLNAIDETLPAILDRVARQVNMRYRTEGNTIVVTPDTPYLKAYPVNYVNMSRNTNSSIGVSGQIATPGASGGTAAAGTQSSAATPANSSSTQVASVSTNNFWELIRENIRSILSATRALSMSAEDKAARAEILRSAREERLQQAEAVARAGASAATLFTTAFGTPPSALPGEAKDDIVVNPVAGTVSILATEKQHALVQQYLDGVMAAVQRQVLIEATIVEVRLSDAYQSGVDWKRVLPTGGFSVRQGLLAGNLGTEPNLTVGYSNALGNFDVTIKLLEQFGNTRVLSSPKLMALNNQTALLKVVDNLVYFSLEAQTNTTQGVQQTTFNSTAHTVPVGMIMSMTPQISESGAVSLTVRPTISRILGYKNDPNPNLGTGAARIINPVPEIQVREMESVLQVASGQTVIMGGLMQDDVKRNRDQVPGLGDLPGVGSAFSYRNESAAKTELVIFLRPTTIANPSLESDELKFFQRFLPQRENTAAP